MDGIVYRDGVGRCGEMKTPNYKWVVYYGLGFHKDEVNLFCSKGPAVRLCKELKSEGIEVYLKRLVSS